jgi:hypothetical protein
LLQLCFMTQMPPPASPQSWFVLQTLVEAAVVHLVQNGLFATTPQTSPPGQSSGSSQATRSTPGHVPLPAPMLAMHVGPEGFDAQQTWVVRSHCVEPHVTKPGFDGPGPMLPQTTIPPSVGPPELDDVPLLDVPPLLLAPLLELEVPALLVDPLEEPVPLEVLVPVVVLEVVEPPVLLLLPVPPDEPLMPPAELPLPPEELVLAPEVPPSDAEASALIADWFDAPQAVATSVNGRTVTRTRSSRTEDMSPPDGARRPLPKDMSKDHQRGPGTSGVLRRIRRPKVRKLLTAEQLIARATKARPTRTASSPADKRQKPAMKGHVTGVQITPVISPSPSSPEMRQETASSSRGGSRSSHSGAVVSPARPGGQHWSPDANPSAFFKASPFRAALWEERRH